MRQGASGTGCRAGGVVFAAMALLVAQGAPPGVQGQVHQTTVGASAAPATAGRVTGPAAAARYVGSEQCETCHRGEFLRFSATRMGRQLLEHPRTPLEARGCESCHGAGSEHVAVEGRERVAGFYSFSRNDPAPVEERNAACLQCHAGTRRIGWEGSPHELREVACTDCHAVMSPAGPDHQLKRATVMETCGQCHTRQMRSQQLSFSRMPLAEGKLGCTNCHEPHGSPNDRLLVAATVNDVCYSCHAEKRGPFLWEHAPVAESCSNCHDPHGSRHEKMLAVPKPRLCQQCHIESRHPTGPQDAEASTRFVMGRQCANCHFNIHGSNHPGGTRFTR